MSADPRLVPASNAAERDIALRAAATGSGGGKSMVSDGSGKSVSEMFCEGEEGGVAMGGVVW